MNHPGSAREVLIAEALGDLARLLDRAEAMQGAMLESRQALIDAHTQLADQLATFEIRVAALMEKAKVQAVKHILARTDEAARQSVQVQTLAMSEAAQALFKAEIDPALQRLAGPLRQLVQRADRPWGRWQFWLVHAVTVVGVNYPDRRVASNGNVTRVLLSSVFLPFLSLEGCGHVVEGCGGGQHMAQSAVLSTGAPGAPQAHRPHVHGPAGRAAPGPRRLQVFLSCRFRLQPASHQACAGDPEPFPSLAGRARP